MFSIFNHLVVLAPLVTRASLRCSLIPLAISIYLFWIPYIDRFIYHSWIPWLFSYARGNFRLSISEYLVLLAPSVAHTSLRYPLIFSIFNHFIFPIPSIAHSSLGYSPVSLAISIYLPLNILYSPLYRSFMRPLDVLSCPWQFHQNTIYSPLHQSLTHPLNILSCPWQFQFICPGISLYSPLHRSFTYIFDVLSCGWSLPRSRPLRQIYDHYGDQRSIFSTPTITPRSCEDIGCLYSLSIVQAGAHSYGDASSVWSHLSIGQSIMLDRW